MGSGLESLIDGIFGILFIMLGAVGEHLDKYPMGGYVCPSYCGVDHEHIMGVYGHSTDNRDTGHTSGSSSRPWVGLHVSDKVHNKRCYQGFKGLVRNNSQANRYKQNSEGRGKKDFVLSQHDEGYVHQTNERR